MGCHRTTRTAALCRITGLIAQRFRLSGTALSHGPEAAAGREPAGQGHFGAALRGDRDGARQFYERAVQPATADPGGSEVAELAGKVFDELTTSRNELIGALRAV
jgi:hypothetical protein